MGAFSLQQKYPKSVLDRGAKFPKGGCQTCFNSAREVQLPPVAPKSATGTTLTTRNILPSALGIKAPPNFLEMFMLSYFYVIECSDNALMALECPNMGGNCNPIF